MLLTFVLVFLHTIAAVIGDSDVYATVAFFEDAWHKGLLSRHNTKSDQCINLKASEFDRVSSFYLKNNAKDITLYAKENCGGEKKTFDYFDYYAHCRDYVGTSYCNFNDRTRSFKVSFYTYPFAGIDETGGVRRMNVGFGGYDFARCVEFSQPASHNFSLRYCDRDSNCAELPPDWEPTGIRFDGLVDGVETYEDLACSSSSKYIKSKFNHPNGPVQSKSTISDKFRSFKIKSTKDTSYYIGRSIYDYDFKVDETDFPTVQKLLKIELKEVPNVSEIVFTLGDKIPFLSEALAVAKVMALAICGTGEGETEWRRKFLEKLPDAISQEIARNSLNQIQAELDVVVFEIKRFNSTTLTVENLKAVNEVIHSRLFYVVNYMLHPDGIFTKYPLHSISVITLLVSLVHVQSKLLLQDQKFPIDLFERTFKLATDFQPAGLKKRLEMIEGMDSKTIDAVMKLDRHDLFKDSDRIDCMPKFFGTGCMEDHLNAEKKVCAHTNGEPCREGYAKLVKLRFEQSYQPILNEASATLLETQQSMKTNV